MNAPGTTRATCLLLMAALVHQLGASPCGCLEHNGWRQSVVCLLGEHQPSGHAVEEDRVQADGCEHSPTLTAMVPNRLEPPTRTFGGFGTPAASPEPHALAFAVSVRRDVSRSAGKLAPPVRAQMQVFRL